MGLDGPPAGFAVVFTIVPLLMVAMVVFGIYAAARRYRAAKRQGLDPFAADVQLMGEARRSFMRGQLGPVGPSREGQDAQEGTVEERLRRLDQLRRSGLVSPEEYEQQRRRILDSL